ncbi:MAG TPA: rhomboid family intramembrane serine protease [Bacteroidia bacterium]|nr:rhomboid family intramembrane serine protease [Bacteroidia bacterium]
MSQFQFRPVRGVPFVVMNLIIINVIFFIAKFFAAGKGIDLDQLLGMHNPMSPFFHWWQVVTHMFMHANLMHLLFNMLGLYFFGKMLEVVWGEKRFIIYYLVCGLGASAIYIGWETWRTVSLLNQDGNGWALLQEYVANYTMVGMEHPAFNTIYGTMVGASGAIFGLLMGAALLFPNTEVQLLLMYVIPVRLKIKWIAILYGGFELLSGLGGAQEDHVAHFAHIGGMIFGFILIQIYKRNRSNFY